ARRGPRRPRPRGGRAAQPERRRRARLRDARVGVRRPRRRQPPRRREPRLARAGGLGGADADRRARWSPGLDHGHQATRGRPLPPGRIRRRREVACRSVTAPLATRAARALRHPPNWIQLAKFGAVGVTGYVINLAVYTALLGLGAHTAALISFVVSAANNYWWNRHWTFAHQKGH